jgi:hypothetical protein
VVSRRLEFPAGGFFLRGNLKIEPNQPTNIMSETDHPFVLSDTEPSPRTKTPRHEGAEKPAMSHTEATLHASVAGQRGAREAAAEGSAVDTPQILAETAAGGVVIGGIRMARPAPRSVFAIRGLAKLFSDEELFGIEDTALMAFCFHDSATAYELCYNRSDKEAAAEALLQQSRNLVADCDDDELDEVREWCLERFLELNTAKKKRPEMLEAHRAARRRETLGNGSSSSGTRAPVEVPAG